MIDFNKALLVGRAKTLKQFVSLFLFSEKASPLDLNLKKPVPSSDKLVVLNALLVESSSLLRWAHRRGLAYVRAGMPKTLVEYAVARDILEALGAFRKRWVEGPNEE